MTQIYAGYTRTPESSRTSTCEAANKVNTWPFDSTWQYYLFVSRLGIFSLLSCEHSCKRFQGIEGYSQASICQASPSGLQVHSVAKGIVGRYHSNTCRPHVPRMYCLKIFSGRSPSIDCARRNLMAPSCVFFCWRNDFRASLRSFFNVFMISCGISVGHSQCEPSELDQLCPGIVSVG
ncbi:hypothetical protein FA95DRAFT_278703 [Auriscalpium vulgare]|uniref:Uncharacterized protein n=1 Tax=Auriscalpium vulgare TaxID=40419 RepID=A0ACB8S4F3_9AGAM|nr:hypothetical protein FA95DRAFT_278703 [Auriscalpium vulgare]